MPLPILRTAALASAIGLMAGCVPPPPAVPAPLVADPGDPCGRNVAELNSIAGFFEEPDPRLPPPDTLPIELQSENNALERLQVAFGTLMQCRWAEAKAGPGEIGRLRREAAQAGVIRDLAEARGRRLEAAVEAVSPGARATISAAAATPGATLRAVAGATVELRLQPDTNSAIVARLPPGARALLQPGPGGYAMADGGPQARGYAPAAAFIVVPEVQVAGGSPASGLVGLAATGAARRTAFGRAIALADQPPPY